MGNKTITIHQGIGAEAMEMTVQVTQEELDKMEKIRKQNPSDWIGKDFDLLKDAKKQIAHEREEMKQVQNDTNTNIPIESDDEKTQTTKERSHKKLIIWIIVLLLAVFAFIWCLPIIKMSSISWGGEMKSHPQGVMKEEAGATFFLPNNWKYSIDTSALYIKISMESTKEPLFFNILWEPSTYYSLTSHSCESEAKVFADANKGKDRTTRVSQIPFNGSLGYEFATVIKVDNTNYYQTFLFYTINKGSENERLIIMNKVAHSINSLNSDVFKQIENSFKYKKIEQSQYHFNTEISFPKLSDLNLLFVDGITFQYPVNWSFEDQTTGRVKYYSGSNEQGDRCITYSWVNGIEIKFCADELLKNSCADLKSEFDDIRFWDKRKTVYNSYNAVSQRLKYSYMGVVIYGQIICIVQEKSVCTIIKTATSEKDLESEDFKIMENTFKMP